MIKLPRFLSVQIAHRSRRHLEQINSAIYDLEKQTSGFSVTIPKERFEEFLKQEAELLKKLNIDDQQVKQALKLLTEEKKSGDSQNLQANAREALDSLRQYRDLVCAIEKQNREGLKASGELLEALYSWYSVMLQHIEAVQ